MNNININIDELKSQILVIGNHFQCLEDKEGLSLISKFTNNLYNFYSELMNIKNNNLDDEILKNLNDSFNTIIEAIKNEDFIYLGDIFLYELLPIVDKVENIIIESV